MRTCIQKDDVSWKQTHLWAKDKHILCSKLSSPVDWEVGLGEVRKLLESHSHLDTHRALGEDHVLSYSFRPACS